jgi:Holliday junction resolvase RusA-like endonuclease
MHTLLIPFPPATNNLFINLRKGGRARSERYNDWIAEALAMLGRQELPKEPYRGPVSLEIAVGRPDNRKRDIDGVLKPALDLLERAQVYENDSQVHRLNVYWCPQTVGVCATVMPLGEM